MCRLEWAFYKIEDAIFRCLQFFPFSSLGCLFIDNLVHLGPLNVGILDVTKLDKFNPLILVCWNMLFMVIDDSLRWLHIFYFGWAMLISISFSSNFIAGFILSLRTLLLDIPITLFKFHFLFTITIFFHPIYWPSLYNGHKIEF